MELLAIKLEGKRKAYNASRFWFHFAICPSTRTSAVFTVVSRLNTVTKTFLLRKGFFLIHGTLSARTTKPKNKNYRGIKGKGFIHKHEPVTSTRCSDCLLYDSAIRALFGFEDGS
jgi:hypothetical protein